MPPETVATIACWVTLPSILLLVGLGLRATMTYLQPQEAKREHPAKTELATAAKRSRLAAHPYRYPISSLVWQSIHHDPRVLLGLVTSIGLGTISLPMIWMRNHFPVSLWFADFFILTGLVAVSWLGVFAFTGDGNVTCLRFLADRGVSSWLTWLGRHLIAISVLSTVLLLPTAVQIWIIPNYVSKYGSISMPVWSVATLAMLLAIIYGVSQWTSQVIRLLAGTAFLAPLLSGCMVVWLVMAGTMMGCSPWLILLCIAIPFLATVWMMGRHMEGRRDAVFWGVHGVAALACVLLPIASMAWDIYSFPSLSGDRLREVRAMAQSVPRAPHPGFRAFGVGGDESFRLPTDAETPNDDGLMPRIAVAGDGPQAWMDIEGPPDTPLQMDWHLFSLAIGSTEYHRLKLISDPSDENRKSFSQWSNTLVEIARRLRLSARIIDQQADDEIEIYLTQAYAKPEMAAWADQTFTTTAIDLISDRRGRREARRRAGLLSWARMDRGGEDGEAIGIVGFLDYRWFSSVPRFQYQWIHTRGMNAIIHQLLRMIDADEAGESSEPMRRQLHALIFGSGQPYEVGPYAKRMQPSGAPNAAMSNLALQSFPALAWFAPWEADAEKLAQTR